MSASTNVKHHVKARHEFRGLRSAEHYFELPLDHGNPAAGSITVFAREYSSAKISEAHIQELPWLLYLQGGPGGRGNRWNSLGGWAKEASKSFRILMLDQRGTGLSSPIEAKSLAALGALDEQVAYLRHFRADSIVADAELIRRTLGSAPWTIYGQSYGGFCALSYLSFAPEGLKAALLTGGLAPLTGPADDVYRATFARVEARNKEYFGWYPEDRELTTKIARHLENVEEFLPTGERLTPERFQMLGSFLGGNTRVDALHYVLEDAFIATAAGVRLSDNFLSQVSAQVSRAANPLYALMHESIYGQGSATNWAAWRVLNEFPQFRPDAADPLFTGEMVYPWYFEQDPALVPLADVAQAIAQVNDWPALYNTDQLAKNTVPVAAAVYEDDIYVDKNLSLVTASAVQGLQTWVTDEFHHDGIADDGEGIFRRLLAMTREQP
ncbi:alpha/beta fold hydrolase [Pseudarthrobacter sp. J1738]|uniref:alpha/beta fold hydrolase n=1 Tax=unclassified Pseudarthrobacter TaxID=2647000 RepID=UPI003D28721B